MIVFYYLLAVNALGFLIMLYDKNLAKKKRWRVPEKVLMGIAAIGGSVGSLLGMYTARHKTKHIKFTLGIPAILVVQIIVAVLYIVYC